MTPLIRTRPLIFRPRSERDCGIIHGPWARSSMAEQLTLNQRVEGSSPSGLTTIPRTKRPPAIVPPGVFLCLVPRSYPHYAVLKVRRPRIRSVRSAARPQHRVGQVPVDIRGGRDAGVTKDPRHDRQFLALFEPQRREQ